LTDYVQRFGGADFAYAVVSAEKAPVTNLTDEKSQQLENFAGFAGGARPLGICPGGELVKDNWCVIIDKTIETTAGDKFTHFMVQKQNALWIVEGIPDSGQEIFNMFGCQKW
jgi:hypothetical protein